MLKAKIRSLDELPEDERAVLGKHYAQHGDWWILQGEVASDDLNRLAAAKEHANRERHQMEQERDALRAKVAELEAKLSAPPAPPPASTTPSDDVIKAAVDQRTKALEAQIAELEKRAKAADEKAAAQARALAEATLDSTLAQAAKDAGVADYAVPDAINRARPFWPLREDGSFAAVDPKTKTPLFSNKHPGQPVDPAEFFQTYVLKDAPHLLRPSGGGGAGGGGNGAAGAPGAHQFTLTEAQAHDVKLWRQTQAAAEKAGAEVVIVPNPT
jgi:BMFP domain-containing protein YqiC